ncbi:hypothetical protein COU88_00915 [Candidatus Roizmanbacteria bacterium CG10_big_fil_rev_8_21_14_0_10_39_6]|uniref:Uncharacterized protein n=1 Tax=Candidatus Roizmanbacteria bacterium CG10_big_fil_rev_8_21_14_0_10_39_6 TaxID=1974853 RepID=A0A2M8KTH8_9BACT|nr:MAG: hypothetical protein COU88_00915 [Candidatus Roizmanbacteria bacterium CG10_big_fil_rev_8_21_14_0_10_39_6]
MSADTIRTTQQADFRSLMSQLGVNREILLAQPATVCIIGIGLSFGERALFGDYTDDGVWLPRSNVQGIWACDENDYFNLVPDSSAYAKLHRLGLSVTSVQSFIPEIQESSPMQLCHAPFGQAVRAIQKPFFDIVTFCRIPNLVSQLRVTDFWHTLSRVVKPGGYFITTGSMDGSEMVAPPNWQVVVQKELPHSDPTLIDNRGYVLQKKTNLGG